MYTLLKKSAICATLALALPGVAMATNGSFLIGAGAKHRALGGAGVALPLDATSILINPASAHHVGTRGDVGGMLFVPRRQACTRAVPECVKSGADYFFLPNMGGAMRFKRKISFGFAASGVGGGNTRYNRDIFVSGGPENTVGADLKQMIMAPTVAYRVHRKFTIGGSPLIGIQQFRAYGLDSFITPAITSEPDGVTNNGNDWAFGGGIRLGGLARFYKGKFNIGASVSSRVYMTKFDKYDGLFTEDGEFDIPAHGTIGIAFKPSDKLSVAFDVTHILFSDVDALGNDITNTTGVSTNPGGPTTPLGAKGGGGFGWDDQTVYKLGIMYDWNDKLTLRMGANYGEAPVPEDDNLLPATIAPVTTEWHAALGFTYELSRSSEFSFSWVHAFRNELSNFDTGQFNISPGGGATIEMVQNSFDLSYALKF